MFSSLRNRLFLTYSLIIFVVLCIVGAALVTYVIRNPAVDRQTYAVLDDIADRILDRNISHETIPEVLTQAKNLQDYRVLISDKNKKIIFDSMEEIRDPIRPEFLTSNQSQRGRLRIGGNIVWLFTWRPLNGDHYLIIARERVNRSSILF